MNTTRFTPGILTAVLASLLAVTLLPAHGQGSFADWLKRDRDAQRDFTEGKKPAEAEPAETEPAETEPAETEPAEAEPADRAVQREPAREAVVPDRAAPGWLVMVYIAGDNNLDPFGVIDVREMETVGSSANLKIAVLMDREDARDWDSARRFLVRSRSDTGGKPSWDPSLPTCEDLGELNMGDPQTLKDFVTWARRTYPQPQTMLVLWNHGGGWRSVLSKALRTGGGARSFAPPPGPAVSRLARGIAWDDTNNGDFLEMREVRGALEDGERFSVIGADACLMSMVEVAYELRTCADYFIGSENTEPGDGWPYDRFLPLLAGNAVTSAEDLCKRIVSDYQASYDPHTATTLTAVRLTRLPKLAAAIDKVAVALMAHTEGARADAVTFRNIPAFPAGAGEFIDLDAFMETLAQGYPESVTRPAAAVRALTRAAIVAHDSDAVLGARGLSIYPGGGYDDMDYRAGIIQFARDTRWDELLRELAYHNKAAARSSLEEGSVERWAVLIGVEEYSDASIPSLQYPADDVDALRSTLIEHAGYRDDHVVVLKDADATVDSVRTTLGTWLPRQVSDSDMVFIYFSGHGGAEPSIREDREDGTEKYMLLSNTKADDMYGTALPMSELARIFARIRADKLLYVMDACYSGATGAGKGVLREGMKAAGLKDAYLTELAGSSGTVVMTASRANEVSMESTKFNMGVFTHFLCQALQGLADSNTDGIVSLSEVWQFVSNRVPDTSRSLGASQHPVLKGEMSGMFPIAVHKAATEGESAQ